MDSPTTVLVLLACFGIPILGIVLRYFMRKGLNSAERSIKNAMARKQNENNPQGPVNLSDLYGGQNNNQKRD